MAINIDHMGNDLDAKFTLLQQNPDKSWKRGVTQKFIDARTTQFEKTHARHKNPAKPKTMLVSIELAEKLPPNGKIQSKDILLALAQNRAAENKKRAAASGGVAAQDLKDHPNAKKDHVWLVRLPGKKFFVIAVEKPRFHPQAHDNYSWYRNTFLQHGFPMENVRLSAFRTTPKKAAILRKKVGKNISTTDPEWKLIPELEKTGFDLPADLDGGQIWHVHYECRNNAVMLSASGEGFFAPGQDMCWHLSAVTRWLNKIHPITK
jgi:hypothetical protein